MPLHHHTLSGCSPTPLAHYLKALGILRLIAEQKDPMARGWWRDESFHLATTLDRLALERFFLEEYRPTPLIAPWNKGAGFVFAANNPALNHLRESTSARLTEVRSAIQQADTAITNLSAADDAIRQIKAETKVKGMTKAKKDLIKDDTAYKSRLAQAERHFKNLKEGLIPDCRRTWRGAHLSWMDAAMVITTEGEAKFPSLLGSGGNDGKNDFTKQFMESLCALADWQSGLPTAPSHGWLISALFRLPTPQTQQSLPIGQFLPGSAGGSNMTTGFDAKAQVNPWDYVLLLEGVLTFIPRLSRRTPANPRAAVSAPFATRTASSGHATASASESDSPRGEQWMPLWEAPCTFADVKGLIGEGRAQLQKSTASRPVDFGRSVARLGVARGINAFERFGYLERNGQSNLAVPLGRWQVTPQPQQELLNDLDQFSWLNRIQRAARDKFSPRSFAIAHRNLETAIMAVCARGREPALWQSLLLALADLEENLVRSHTFTAKQRLRPIPPLNASWISAANDASPELRLAVALALQTSDAEGHDSIRRHWLPLDKTGRAFATDASGLRRDPSVVCRGLDPERDLLALIQRRSTEGSQTGGRHFALHGHKLFYAQPDDLVALLAGTLDLTKTIRLSRAFMALDRRSLFLDTSVRIRVDSSSATPPPLYGLFRLACLPKALRRGETDIPIRFDRAIPTRLAVGDLASAGDLALRRLRASGLVPVIRRIAGEPALVRRLALSLAFPISAGTATRLADTLTKPQLEKVHS